MTPAARTNARKLAESFHSPVQATKQLAAEKNCVRLESLTYETDAPAREAMTRKLTQLIDIAKRRDAGQLILW